MPVTVHTSDRIDHTLDHGNHVLIKDSHLIVADAPNGRTVAIYAPGTWINAKIDKA